ncbi:MAG: hypothetical protein V1849_04325 [Chloroflexota bacterium]
MEWLDDIDVTSSKEKSMPLSTSRIEQLAEWCARSEDLADIRSKTRSDYFGYDEAGEVKYVPGAEEVNSRERRFLGWFSFGFRLPDGKHPAELAASALLCGAGLTSALKTIQDARYVMAVVTMVMPGQAVYLELEDEEFEVYSRILSQVLNKGDALCAHIMPVGRERWLVGPGWLEWPMRLGPGIRSHLKRFQLDPVNVERFLQQRRIGTTEERPRPEYPRDRTLEEAVARMTEAARADGRDRLVRSVEEWKTMVLACMKANDFNRFSKDVVKRAGEVPSLDDLNRWLALAMNIWNSTPQPDCGGRTAYDFTPGMRDKHTGQAP